MILKAIELQEVIELVDKVTYRYIRFGEALLFSSQLRQHNPYCCASEVRNLRLGS